MGSCQVAKFCRNRDHLCDCCIGASEHEEDWDENPQGLSLLYHVAGYPDAPTHPYQKHKRAQRQQEKRAQKHTKERITNKLRTRRAARNEELTRRAIVRATQGSGARNGDGDSRLGDGTIGIEDKMQSRSRKQFVTKTDELDKAHRQGCLLVVTNADGEKIAIARLEWLLEHAADLVSLRDHT